MGYGEYYYQTGIIALVIFITFKIVFENKIQDYTEFVNYLVGDKKILNYSINNLMNIFLLASFIVMISGFGAYFKQEFNLPAFWGSCIIAILSFITFFQSINGIIKANTYLIPILIGLVVLLGIKGNILLFNPNYIDTPLNFSWIIKSVLYASYNSIILIPIIINLREVLTNKNQVKYIVLITFFIMITLSIIIYIALSLHFNEIANLDIPIVYIASKFGIIYKYLYGIIVLIAIFTTAISEGYSFLNNVSKTKKQYFIYSCIICSVAVGFSNIGFGRLLDVLYPVLGMLGLLQIVTLCVPKRIK